MTFFDVPRKLFILLSSKERVKVYWLTTAIVLVSFLEMMGVASIFPFLKVVSSPEVIQTNAKLNWFFRCFGFSSETHFMIALGGICFVILLLSNVFRIVILTLVTKFSWMRHHTIAQRLLRQYLYEPYAFFLKRNSSELITHLTAEIGRVVGYVLNSFMNMFARVIFLLMVFVLLMFVNPAVTLIITVVLGGGYGGVYLLFRKKLFHIGKDLRENSYLMHKVLSESFGGIKDIKLMGKEDVFVDMFSIPSRKNVDSHCMQFLITTVPRYVFEILIFGGMLLVTIFGVIINKNYQQAVPMIGLYALAAYRVMPALQQIFQSISSIRYGQSALDAVHKGMLNYKEYCSEDHRCTENSLPFAKTITLNQLRFQYPETDKPTIQGFDLKIQANTTVGFVGSTGAGKTTIIDILLGLLSPQGGEILIDGVKLCKENLRMWQNNIGYVPQHIYLTDDTIAANIAFGVPGNRVSQETVEQAARLANIHNFIMRLPDGYATKIGERGVRLSGGERQRVGIARALYYNPSLLVFDEATSALDGITENAVIDAINGLSHKKTIIMIAHRLTSVKYCDVIYLLDSGRIAASGTYQELLNSNEQFRKMARTHK